MPSELGWMGAVEGDDYDQRGNFLAGVFWARVGWFCSGTLLRAERPRSTGAGIGRKPRHLCTCAEVGAE